MSARKKIDPAIISMLVTLLGFFCFPVASAYLGFLLGGMALHKARAGGGGSEKLAKIAVIVSFACMLLSASVCMAFAIVGTGYELYELVYELGVWQALF
jgi:predicted small integral membrane protein